MDDGTILNILKTITRKMLLKLKMYINDHY